MVGIVLVSHGDMAKGMLNSAGMFFGADGLAQVKAIGLYPEENPEEFDVKLVEAIEEVNTGDGVYVLCDLFGGTPGNRSALKCGENIKVIAGVNLALFMELLGMRMYGEVNADSIVDTGKNGIVSYNKLFGK